MSQYRKKPVVIEAEQFSGREAKSGRIPYGVKLWPDERGLQPRDMSWGYIDTPDRRIHVYHADWICRQTVDGREDIWPVRPDIFAATYEPVDPPTTDPEHPTATEGA